LVVSYIVAQLIATIITVYADWRFTDIEGTRTWGWVLAVWVWCLVWYIPMDVLDCITEKLLTQSWDENIWYRGYSGLDHSLGHMGSTSSQRRELRARGMGHGLNLSPSQSGLTMVQLLQHRKVGQATETSV